MIVGSDYTESVGSPTELSVNGRIAADLAASSVVVVRGRQPRTTTTLDAARSAMIRSLTLSSVGDPTLAV